MKISLKENDKYKEWCDECCYEKDEVIEFASHRREQLEVDEWPVYICLECVKLAINNYEQMLKVAKEEKRIKEREAAIRKNNEELRLSTYAKNYFSNDPYDI